MQWVVRVIAGALVVVCLVSACVNPGLLPEEHVLCLKDLFFVWTDEANKFFEQNVNTKHILQIVFGFMMDFVLLYTFYRWAIYGKSWRLPIALTALYSLRYFFYVSTSVQNKHTCSSCSTSSSHQDTYGSSQEYTRFRCLTGWKTTSSSADMWD